MFEENNQNNIPLGNQPEDLFAKTDEEGTLSPSAAGITPPTPSQSLGNQEIHTMPEKFLDQPKKSISTAAIVIIILLIFLILSGTGIFLFRDKLTNFLGSYFGAKVALKTDINSVDLNVNQVTNANENTNTEEPANTNANPDLGPISLDSVLSAKDSDNDSLTDAEESLYQTDSQQIDTDKDGYLDGSEVINFYDPKNAGAKLSGSAAVKKYTSQNYGYSIYYPAAWQIKNVGGGDQEIMFESAIGEFIEVSVQDNLNNLSVLDWYSQNMPLVDLNQIQKIKIGSTEAIKSLDGFSVYFAGRAKGKNYIYTITYNIGNKTEASFKSTFQMMQKSFEFVSE